MNRPRLRGWVMALVMCVSTATAAEAQGREWLAPLTDHVLQALVARGLQRSFTFRELAARIEQSDVVVHLTRAAGLRANTGVTQFITASGGRRVVRITLNVETLDDAGVALLAHELLHVTEVAAAAHVSTPDAYARLYERIGHASCAGHSACFDTRAAIDTGLRVLGELGG